jgi:hypothetical protein
MTRVLSVLTALSILVASDANQYYYARPHAWGVNPAVINAKAKQTDPKLKKVKNTSDKPEADEEELDDFEKAEEAIFHAVEEVEDKVIHAIDDEVETIFPHHNEAKEE